MVDQLHGFLAAAPSLPGPRQEPAIAVSTTDVLGRRRSALTDSLPRPPPSWLNQWAGGAWGRPCAGRSTSWRRHCRAWGCLAAPLSRCHGRRAASHFGDAARAGAATPDDLDEESEEVESDSHGYGTPPMVPSPPPSRPALLPRSGAISGLLHPGWAGRTGLRRDLHAAWRDDRTGA